MDRLKVLLDRLLSIGAYDGELDDQRARRRVIVGTAWLASLLSVPTVLQQLSEGPWSAAANSALLVVTGFVLVGLRLRPHWFRSLVTLMLGTVVLDQLVLTAMFGGLVQSGLVVLYDLLIVLVAMLALGARAATWWFGAFVASVVFAVVVPHWIAPIYRPRPIEESALSVIATGLVTYAIVWYFVRQRDRFQRASDELLRNILPVEVAARLKASPAMIADAFESASVLFADVVDFTPLSAGLSPVELVGLLDEVFTTFDGFVAELGLEKIKTIGDAYMVASGVPVARLDHAPALAELALRMRDHVATHAFKGHTIALRIGINSGPVVAGIIGRHKFAYDLWGDVVNIASRMESTGLPGSIQVSAITHDLIQDRFVCQPRGIVDVKGKGPMSIYLVVGRHQDVEVG